MSHATLTLPNGDVAMIVDGVWYSNNADLTTQLTIASAELELTPANGDPTVHTAFLMAKLFDAELGETYITDALIPDVIY